MKKTKHRLLSLLLAVVMICSMAPAAMAWGETLAINQSTTVTAGFSSTYNAGGWLDLELKDISWSCSSAAVRVTPISSYNGLAQQATITGVASTNEAAKITATATYGVPSYAIPSMGSQYQNYTVQDSVDFYFFVSNLTYPGGTTGGTTGGTSVSHLASLSQGTMSMLPGEVKYLYIEPVTGYTLANIQWEGTNPYITAQPLADGSMVQISASSLATGVYSSGVISVSADVYYGSYYQGTVYLGCTITVGTGVGSGTGTGNVGTGTADLYLAPDSLSLAVGQASVINALTYNSAITPYLETIYWYTSNPTVASVYNTTGTNATGYTTGSAVQVYGLSAGTATIYADLRLTTGYSLTATCEVVVGGGAAADIDVLYSATVGQSLSLNASDFQKFWQANTYSRGQLQYVVFGTSTGNVGKLVYNRLTGTSYQNSLAVGSNTFYASPVYGQYGISDVTFTPNKVGTSYSTGTLAVPFTAYGTSAANSTSVTTASGTLYIIVTNGEVSAISYTPEGGSVTLDPADFVAVYKQTLSTTTTATNPSVFIQFLDVPNFGELHYNYGSSIYTSSSALTAANIATLRFTTRSTGTYCIEDVTYIPSSTGTMAESIRYAAYSAATGGTLLYIGEINFAAGSVPTVKFITTAGKSVPLNVNDFLAASKNFSSYVSINAPSSGTLYRDYVDGKGTVVSGGSTFSLSPNGTHTIPSVNTLTFVPSATGVVEIPFISSNILGSQSNGVIKVYVGKTFSDVASNHWASEYITQLTAEGIVNGKTETTFAPNDNLKYGEALKLIMEAAGYSSQVKTGTHWASGYLTRAYRDGLVTSTSIDLNSEIDRNTVATIAAKALKLGTASTVTAGIVAPSDSTNGYVLALYNAGILNGTYVNGKNYYYGSNTITRAEISKIICKVSDYSNK